MHAGAHAACACHTTQPWPARPWSRYKQLLFYATKLEPLPAEDHVPSNKVEGCVSQVRGAGQRVSASSSFTHAITHGYGQSHSHHQT